MSSITRTQRRKREREIVKSVTDKLSGESDDDTTFEKYHYYYKYRGTGKSRQLGTSAWRTWYGDSST